MTLLKRLKQAAIAMLATAALYTSALAEEPKPVKTEARISLETNRDPTAQAIVSYDKHKLFMEAGNNKADIGANIEDESFRVNLAYRHRLDSDQARALAVLRSNGHFAGLEYQFLGKDHHVATAVGGTKITDFLSLEATLNTDKNAAGAAFVEIAGNLFSIGGKTDFNKDWEANTSYTRKLSESLTLYTHLRIGDNDLLDARLMAGPGVYGKKSRAVFTATESGFNCLSKVSEATFPFFLGGFDLTGADTATGKKTGGMAIDIRYIHDNRGYCNIAVNAGDYLFVKDVTPSFKFNRNIATNTNYVTMGLRTEIEEIGLKIWYEMDIYQDLKTEHRVSVGFAKEF